jgi:hypothetical protein
VDTTCLYGSVQLGESLQTKWMFFRHGRFLTVSVCSKCQFTVLYCEEASNVSLDICQIRVCAGRPFHGLENGVSICNNG